MNEIKEKMFYEYYEEWVKLYKEGAIREVSLKKYKLVILHLKNLVPNLKLCDIDRIAYQQLLNDFALTHEKQTTLDFHHLIKASILDAVDEGWINRDPTRKAVIKGKTPRVKKTKFLNQFELHLLLKKLELTEDISWDWLILLIAKTGIRFSEALAITPDDFDFSHQQLHITKTWNYKVKDGGFEGTKNESSKRIIMIDWQTVMQFSQLVKNLEVDKPIFVNGRVFNSTINNRIEKLCKVAEIQTITVHGLRHTHASILLYAGVSIASVARRLGHADMNTTQKTYLHIIQELENQDNDKVMRQLSSLY